MNIPHSPDAPPRFGMLRPYEPLLMSLLRFVDALTGVAVFAGMMFYFDANPPHLTAALFVVFVLTAAIFHYLGIYRSWRFFSLRHEIYHIFSGCLILYTCLFLTGYFFKAYSEFSRPAVINWMVIWPAIMSAERVAVRLVLRHFRKRGYNLRSAVIAGAGETGEEMARLIRTNPWSGAKLMGFFDDKIDGPVARRPVLGKLNELPPYARAHGIDIVYLALPMRAEGKIKHLLKELSDSTSSVFFVPDIFFLDLMLGGSLIYFSDFPVMALRDTPIHGINYLLKRTADLSLSVMILTVTAPIFALIALAVKLNTGGPIFFVQTRYGLNGRPIRIYKFRTMTVCEEGDGFRQVCKNDPRVTRLGAFLRRTSLDELPQFINVIQGRMSIVGPRPHPVAMNEQYRKLVPGYMLRHKVKPGITGLAQINGFRGETDTLDKIENRIKYDLDYLRQWSLVLDFKIMLKTVLNGSWRNNAY